MTDDPLPLAAPNRPAPPPAPAAGEGRAFWRTLLTLAAGFALPVLACYGFVFVSALACQLALVSGPRSGLPLTPAGSGPAVAVIRVEGVIASGEASPFDVSRVAGAATLVDQIERAAEDDAVRAILLRVNSPGGGVAASDIIYHALKQVDKPIVVLMGDTAASGGYYISMAADWLIANPNTLTGSIGVISEFPTAEGLLEEIGVEFVVITSGARKDFGSPYRDMTPEERAYWQTTVDEIYADFVAIVAEGRGMTVDDVLPLADGGVFTGQQALEAGLIDALGYEDDAIAKAAELGGIRGEPRLIEYDVAPGFFDLLRQAARGPELVPSLAELVDLAGLPRLQARWVR
ncbi:MAG: signal peptide peptidase SppA [Anaerolineales bacterium]|nr:signal peptide peptidase SppA [Anaerolineales bacterium]